MAELKKDEKIIQLVNVTKAFDETVAVENVSFYVRKGEFITFLGPSGCGKTTTLRMIAGFDIPTSGKILLNGQDITNLPPNKRPVNTVFQRYALFPHLNIYDNIAFSRPGATREEVIAAAKAAKIHNFIMGLPDGYDTIVSDDGLNISQGQKQMLTIARAMLSDAKMLILDEATSNVDTRTEQQIQEAMRALMKDRTCFVIAHRLSTVQNADTILVVQHGDIIEQGSHDELMQKGGVYAGLYTSQFN